MKTLILPAQTVHRWMAVPEDFTARPFNAETSRWGAALVASMNALTPQSFNGEVVPLYAVVEQIGSLLAMACMPQSVPATTYRMALAMRLVSIMWDNHGDAGFTPAKLAKLAGISSRTLFSSFSSTGASFSKRLRFMRLEKAAHYMKNSSCNAKTVKEISAMVGYRSLPLFSRHFHNAYGLSPSS